MYKEVMFNVHKSCLIIREFANVICVRARARVCVCVRERERICGEEL